MIPLHFSSPDPHFTLFFQSLGVSRGLGWCVEVFKIQSGQTCTLGLSGHLVKPWRLFGGPPGLHNVNVKNTPHDDNNTPLNELPLPDSWTGVRRICLLHNDRPEGHKPQRSNPPNRLSPHARLCTSPRGTSEVLHDDPN